jgi:hypothetical protein
MVDGATLDRATAKDAEAFRRKIAEFEEAFPGDPLKEEEEGLLLKVPRPRLPRSAPTLRRNHNFQ